MDRSYMSIKPWNPLFDAKEESMSTTSVIWIKLLGLQIKFLTM
jgi:hypothetical protein